MSWQMLAHGNHSVLTLISCVTVSIFNRIVMSFETVATTYTRQIPVNENVTFRTPFVTVSAENVS